MMGHEASEVMIRGALGLSVEEHGGRFNSGPICMPSNPDQIPFTELQLPW